MEPQAPQTTTSSLDPQAVALTQAIRQMESGGTNDPSTQGKSGEYGAYQWLPSTWAKMSQAAGVDVPLEGSTLEQQNEVAYKQIKTWKDEGYNVGQIASMWNAGPGRPNAYLEGNSGTNAEGVSYDTQKYAQQVANIYQQKKQQLQPSQGQNTSPAGYQAPAAPGTPQASQSSQAGSTGYQPPAPPPTSTGQDVSSTSTPTPGTVQPPGSQFGNNAVNWLNPPAGTPWKNFSDWLGTEIAKATSGTQGAQFIQQNEPGPTGEQAAGSALQTAGDIGAIASAPFTGGLSTAGLIGTGAALGAAQSAGGALQKNAPTSQVVQQGALGGTIGAVASGILGLVSKALGAAATKSLTLAVKPTAADFADGFDAQFAVKNGLTGDAVQIAQKTKDFMGGLTTQLKTALGNSDIGIDLANIFDNTKADLTSSEGLDSNFLQNSNVQGALDKLENEVLQVNPSGELPLLRAQTIKQQTGMYGEWLNGAPDPEANAMSTVANSFYRNLKTAIENSVPEGNIADINEQIQNAIPIMRAAIRRIPVAARASALSISDMLGLLGLSSTGGLSAALPLVQHAMGSGLVSQIAPTASNAFRAAIPALSASSPALLGGFLGRSLAPGTNSGQ